MRYRIKEAGDKFYIQYENVDIIRGIWGIDIIKKWKTYQMPRGNDYNFMTIDKAKKTIDEWKNPPESKYYYIDN